MQQRRGNWSHSRVRTFHPRRGSRGSIGSTSSTEVFVKAGPETDPHTLYTYNPDVSSDVGLESLKSSVSHALFCFSPPTALRVTTFSATRTATRVVLRWRTATEIANLGFNVYRQEGVRRVRLNASLISAGALTGVTGHSYRWVDRPARTNTRYWLQALASDGARTWVASAVAMS